jgi:fructose-bisphosphate aldolase class II
MLFGGRSPLCRLAYTWTIPRIELIKESIALGFTSVMIDVSHQLLEGNIDTTRQVVAQAHERGVSVQAELGKIGTADFLESDTDEEMYTDPQEVVLFVA